MRRLISEGLGGTDVVIGLVPLLQLTIVAFQQDLDVFHLIKLLRMRPVRSLDVTLQLGGSRRNHEQADPLLPTSLLEVFLELRSSVDLDHPDRKRELLFHVFQEGLAVLLVALPAGQVVGPEAGPAGEIGDRFGFLAAGRIPYLSPILLTDFATPTG